MIAKTIPAIPKINAILSAIKNVPSANSGISSGIFKYPLTKNQMIVTTTADKPYLIITFLDYDNSFY